MLTVSAGIYKNTTLSIESRTDTGSYDDGAGFALHNGTGEKARSTTVQLAIEF